MTIHVKYFASLRESMGRAEDELEIEGCTTVEEVWLRVNNGKPMPQNLLAAVNQDYAEKQQPVVDGDEVAFFPPVTGGCM